jgi:hypothetical protein
MGTYRHGQRELTKFSVASASVFSRGDLMYLVDTIGNVNDVAAFTWNSDIATTQAGIADVFAGVAYEGSATGETDDVSVDISHSSVYEFTCTSATYFQDATVGPAKAAGNAALAATVEAAVAASSIGRVRKMVESAATKVEISVASVYNVGANTAAGVIG